MDGISDAKVGVTCTLCMAHVSHSSKTFESVRYNQFVFVGLDPRALDTAPTLALQLRFNHRAQSFPGVSSVSMDKAGCLLW